MNEHESHTKKEVELMKKGREREKKMGNGELGMSGIFKIQVIFLLLMNS